MACSALHRNLRAGVSPIRAGCAASRMRRSVLLCSLVLAHCASRLPRRRARRLRQIMTFEAPRELLVASHARRDARRRSRGFGVTRVRQHRLLAATSRPTRQSRTKPAFDATDPRDLRLGRPRRADRRGAGARHRRCCSPSPARSRAGRPRARKRQPHRPEPEGVRRRSRPRSAAATATEVDTWSIWNEPNQPQFLEPQYTARHSPRRRGIYRSLYQAGRARPAPTPANADDTILIGETSPRGNRQGRRPAGVPARRCCAWTRHYRKAQVLRRARRGRLRPPRVHDRAGPALQARRARRRDDRRARRGSRARSTGRPSAGAIPQAPAGLPDRVRHPEHAGPDLRRQARARRPSTARSPSTSPTSTRACVAFSQYLLSDDPPRDAARASRATAASRAACARRRQGEAGLDGFRLPLAVERQGLARTRSGGSCAPPRGATTVTIAAAPTRQGLPRPGDGHDRQRAATSRDGRGTARAALARSRGRRPTATVPTSRADPRLLTGS